MSTTVLILGGADDDHAVFMLKYLRERNIDCEMLDSRWFPAHMTLAYDPSANTWRLRLPTGRVLESTAIRSVYWRCYNSVATPAMPDQEQAYIASNDARGLFESLLIHLPVRWVNGWDGYLMHQTKPVQLAVVSAMGVPIPTTVLGNDPHAIREFAARVPRSIFKPVQGGAHTRPLTPNHLTDENLGNLAYAPVTLQEEIAGTNIRVFVAGERVLACEVKSEHIDFRDTQDPKIVVHDLPAEWAARAKAIARALHLRWTGIDLRLTPDGRYVFLEANPSPMFLGFEARCGLPLTESLAHLLVEG